jgi:hypothetical protein
VDTLHKGDNDDDDDDEDDDDDDDDNYYYCCCCCYYYYSMSHNLHTDTASNINCTKEEREAAPIGRSFLHSTIEICYNFQHKNVNRHI